MIVKFIAKDKRSTALSLECSYKVLSVEYVLKSNVCFEIKYRILNNEGIPALYDLNIFEIIDSSIDSDFIYKSYSNGNYKLIPKLISYFSFWEDFFNGDEEAEEKFLKRFPEYVGKIF